MDYEKIIGNAIDKIAFEAEDEAQEILSEALVELKKELNAKDLKRERKVELYIHWGQILELQCEYEQSLLRYQKALELDWSNQDALWAMVQVFLFCMQKPDHAVKILEDKLLKWAPENEDYQKALELAKAAFDPELTEFIDISK